MLRRQKLLNLLFVMAFISIFSCQEVREEKPLDELAQKQKQAVQREKEKSSELMRAKEAKEDYLKKSDDEDKLKSELVVLIQSTYAVEAKMADLNEKEEKLEKQKEYIGESDQISDRNIFFEMAKIDSTITNLENEKRIEQKRILIPQKKIDISNAKIKAYEEEKELIDAQRTDKIRENASNNEIKQVENEIIKIDADISTERLKLEDFQSQIANSEKRISEIDVQLKTFTELIKEKYSKKEIVGNFIQIEKGRLNQDLENAKKEKLQLGKQAKFLENEKKRVKGELFKLNENNTFDENDSRYSHSEGMETVNTGKDIEELQENLKQNSDIPREPLAVERSGEKESSLQELAQISEKVATERKESLAKISEDEDDGHNDLENKAGAYKDQPQNQSGWGSAIAFIFLIFIVIFIVLFYLGRSAKRKQN